MTAETRDLAERARWLLDVQHRIQRIHDRRGGDGACVGCALLADLDDDEPADAERTRRLLGRAREVLAAQHRDGLLHDIHGAGWSCSGCALLAELEALNGPTKLSAIDRA